MTFYNHIESARYEMFRLVDAWTCKGAETKARISQSLDQARMEYVRMESENNKLRELCMALYRCTDAGKPCKTCPLFDGVGGCMDNQRMHELGIEVSDE